MARNAAPRRVGNRLIPMGEPGQSIRFHSGIGVPPGIPPGHSAHQTGRAIDFYIGGHNSSDRVAQLRTLPAYQWLVRNAARFGFYPYANEPWHYELRPGAGDRGCPSPYADPTQDPRMQP